VAKPSSAAGAAASDTVSSRGASSSTGVIDAPAGLRLLLLDDSPTNNKMLAYKLPKMLREPQITAVVSAEEAMALLMPAGSAPPFDLCLFDEILVKSTCDTRRPLEPTACRKPPQGCVLAAVVS
jgi:hypothetical protein